jgi:thymidylate synthase ThyX
VEAPGLGAAQDKARAFHEKWVVGYGHSSVAEHAVVHLAVEGASILAAKALEECRLGAYTEKSTRYVRFDHATLVTDVGLPEALAARYETSARALLEVYTQLTDVVEARLLVRHPTPEGTAPRAHQAVLRAHALDLLRGLLPAGVPTNLGLTLNGRALEHHLSKLLGHPLAEVRRVGTELQAEAAVILPTLLKYTAPRAHRDNAEARVRHAHGALHPILAAEDEEPRAVRVVDAPDAPLRTLAAAIQSELYGAPWTSACQAAHDSTHALEVVRAYLSERGAHDAPLRALEFLHFTFEVECDYGAWRDLQRHRLLSATTPRLGAQDGYIVSRELDELAVGGDVRRALDDAGAVARDLARTHPWEAQYAVPLAYRVRYVLRANLRELFHLIELRSARQGHEAYRKIAQDLADGVLAVCPWMDPFLRVDRAAYPFARH